MTPVDHLLDEVCQATLSGIHSIPKRDLRILVSLKKQVHQQTFLTENQSKLLIKIFKENLKFLKTVNAEAEDIITDNIWSQSFRVVEKIRKIYLDNAQPGLIVIEFNFDRRLKELITSLNGKIEGSVISIGPKSYAVALSEKNIFEVISVFRKENFAIDEKISKFYQDIKTIKDENSNPFEIFSLENENLKKIIEADVGSISTDNLTLLQDRKFRYQYKISEKNTDNSLATKIANRAHRNIFINSSAYTLTDVFFALKELHRLPMLAVFDGHDSKINKKSLDLIAEAAGATNTDDHVGIYFRFDKSTDHDGFNNAVANLSYNKILNEKTTIAGIANNKLPKFMVKNAWKPQSVVSFTTNFKTNKSYIYCSNVDLVVYYGERQPLTGGVDVIM